MVRSAYALRAEDDDFGQPGTLVREVMDDADRENLAGNVAGHLSQDVTPAMQQRALDYWGRVDATLASAIAAKLGVSNGHGGANGAGAPDADRPSAEPQATNAPR
jgi:catalase